MLQGFHIEVTIDRAEKGVGTLGFTSIYFCLGALSATIFKSLEKNGSW